MDAKMLTKMVIVGTVFFILVVTWVKLAEWAGEQVDASVVRNQEVTNILEGK